MKFTKKEGQYIVNCLEEAMEEALDWEQEKDHSDYLNVKNKYEDVCNEDMSCDYSFSNDELNIMTSSLIGQMQYLSKGDSEYISIENLINKIEREQETIKKASKTEKIAV